MGYRVLVDLERCEGSGECVEVCPVGVFSLQDEHAVAEHPEECLGCESCVELCESGAIVIEEL
ncbi:indolepyruvate ferredoxin oxidoreductase subunit alpha [Megalodesulfovibrio paquesii]